jgi:hypothetical protein
MQLANLVVFEDDATDMIGKIVSMSSDYEHTLVLGGLPTSYRTTKAESAAARGEPAGILFSANPKFVELVARTAYGFGPREKIPMKLTERLELCGEPLNRLLERIGHKLSGV